MLMQRLRLFLLSLGVLLCWGHSRAQGREDYERAPVNYSSTQPTDVIARLQAQLSSGEVKFGGTEKEIVHGVLRRLQIPIESQLLVFSKTSLQRGRISPETPRSIFFSDTCYVGWVPGGLMEVASIDPALGPVFYAFDPRSATERRFVRDPECLTCHGGTFVPHIPAVFARSVFPDSDGNPLLRQGTQVVDFRTPFAERWGGWYVTGRHGEALHRGNTFAEEKNGNLIANFARGANVTNLSAFFSSERYLGGSSDIVALLVFEHQLAMHNTLTHAAFRCRRMLDYQKGLQEAFKEPVTEEPAYDSVKSVFETCTREIVDALLFKGEAPLPDGIEGNPEFIKAFQATAVRTPDGRSLKDLALKNRIFKNRCSYLIYSEFFLAMPPVLKRRVYERLGRALHPTAPDPAYAFLGPEERASIKEILRQTHPELREF